MEKTREEFVAFLADQELLQEYRQNAGEGSAVDSQEVFDDCPQDCLIFGAFDFGPKFDARTGKALDKYAKWYRTSERWDSILINEE